MSKNTHPCHSGRISRINLPFNYSDSYGMTIEGYKVSWTKKRMSKTKKECRKIPSLVILEESFALPFIRLWDSYGMTTGGYKMSRTKKRMWKNTISCHSERISCITEPSTMQIPTEWQRSVINYLFFICSDFGCAQSPKYFIRNGLFSPTSLLSIIGQIMS